MAFTGSTICTSFTLQLAQGVHDLSTDTLKIALYTNAASLTNATTVYAATNEVAGVGYVAGGMNLAGVTLATSGLFQIFDCTDPVWSPAVFTARGALIYNSSKANKAIAVLDFGSDKIATTSFTVQMPTANPNTALIVISYSNTTI